MTRHLGLQVSAYVDRRLDAPTLRALDQHVTVCVVCRHTADEERRILASLRSGTTPGVPRDLQAALLALAGPAGSAGSPGASGGLGSAGSDDSGMPVRPSAPGSAGPAVPSIPFAPAFARPARVPTVPPLAPPMHRSPRRAAAIAGLAAGASAAAAIGLAVVGPGQGAAATIRPVAPRVAGSTSGSSVSVLTTTALPVSLFSRTNALQNAPSRSGR